MKSIDGEIIVTLTGPQVVFEGENCHVIVHMWLVLLVHVENTQYDVSLGMYCVHLSKGLRARAHQIAYESFSLKSLLPRPSTVSWTSYVGTMMNTRSWSEMSSRRPKGPSKS